MADQVPRMTGTGQLKATHEIHIFLAPIYITPPGLSREAEYQTLTWKGFSEAVERYKAAVADWNAVEKPLLRARDADVDHGEMKAPVLTLIFRDGAGEKPVTVCQSACYVRCNDIDRVRELCHEQAAYFTARGFTVLREKIEASAYGVLGVPQTAAEAALHPSCYFEFHIKVQHEVESDKPQLITETEEKALRAAANTLSRILEIPVPLSYNREKNENNTANGGCQRFLNARFYGLGMAEIKPQLTTLTDAVRLLKGDFTVIKTISEYVWFDTLKAMDHGWIDYSPEELASLKQRLSVENTT